MFRTTWIIAAVLTLAACNVPGPTRIEVGDRPVDASFATGEVSGRGGSIALQYALGIFNYQGEYAVCAAANNVDRSVQQRIMRAIDVTADGAVIVKGLDWAPQYSVPSLVGSTARCVATGVAASEDPEFDVKLSQRRFRD